jgi:hypothetical protein
VDDVIDFAQDILKTPPDDLDRRVGKLNEEMAKKILKSAVIQYQNMHEKSRERKAEIEKLKFYSDKLESILMRSLGPGSIPGTKK